MKRYNPSEIEPKWQKVWDDTKVYEARDFSPQPKYVMLTEFPYPSGDGLHLGHVREYTLGDIMAREKRMHGHNVLYPMGYDAFGLPAENYAIKHKVTPQAATEKNIANFQQQFESLGLSVDWSRSFRTTDPSYYKWTQWLFLQFYKHGLAYQAEIAINWCPHCKTGLANEEVVNGRHERCDTPVEKKSLKQWMLKITHYADRLIEGLREVDYPSRIADQQVNWIGRSVGAEINFALEDSTQRITVFTTRADTLFGATFLVMAPEHELVEKIVTPAQKEAIAAYVRQTQAKTEIERQDTQREKTGVFTGAYALNPVTHEKMPIWVADYVLHGYGTGAIMAVPAHDERDRAFAKKFDLPIVEVIEPETGTPQDNPEFRQSIVAIVRNPRTGQLLTLNWRAQGGQLFVGGGREKGEDIVDTAVREIAEETGYGNVRFVRKTIRIHHNYFARSKGVARHIEAHGLLFDLVDDTKHPTKLESNEKGKFKVEWLPVSEVETKIQDELHELCYEMLLKDHSYHGEGRLVRSAQFDGMSTAEAREKIVAELSKKGIAKERVNYKLRDWIFSRQHYWGEPIPIIHCPKDGAVAVPDAQLPVELPIVQHYEPTDTGESPLSEITEWVTTTCPQCGGPAKRETDTMPNWAGSSWYYLRYFDAHNDHAFADPEKLKYWGMVDLYLGGMEHTTLHLLYSRFWHQFFYDHKLVPTPEPYKARRGQGIVLATDGSKMSKSKGNVINPNEIIGQGYGADALRLAIAFLAPFDQTTPWNPHGVAGTYRFLQRFWTLVQDFLAADPAPGPDLASHTHEAELRAVLHRTIKKVSQDLEHMAFNTAVAALMEGVNGLYKLKLTLPFGAAPELWRETLQSFTKLLAPFAPHLTEEIWQELGEAGSIHVSSWPAWDAQFLVDDTVVVVVQVNGKVRANLLVAKDAPQAEVAKLALHDEKVTPFVSATPKRTIFVPNKLINFVV